MKQDLKLILFLLTVGNLNGIFFLLLRLTRRVRVKGYALNKLNPGGRGLLVICNHPSPVEPMLLPFLWYPWALFRWGWAPYGLPAKEFYDKWWVAPFRPLAVAIDRSSLRRGLETSKRIQQMLKEGKVVTIHPERERIYASGDNDTRVSATGKRMKKFRPGTRRLILSTGCRVLPVWIDGGERLILNRSDHPSDRWVHLPRIWRQVTIKIGEPMEVPSLGKEDILDYFEDVLLELADREM
jgi:1-acyl-sn-glycerol-3-phosphate acyltransferase